MKRTLFFLAALVTFWAAVVTSAVTMVQPYRFATGGGIPTPELLHWPLNDAAGTTIAASVGPGSTGNTGTLNGDYLDMAAGNAVFVSSSTITWGANVVSVSAWVYLYEYDNSGYILQSCETAATPRFSIQKDGGWFTLRNYGTSGSRDERVAFLGTGAWKHVVCVFDGSTAGGDNKLYVDGSEVSLSVETDTRAGTSNFAADKLSIKNPFSEGATFRLDDLRVYSGELSGAQISAIHAAGRP